MNSVELFLVEIESFTQSPREIGYN